jgi:Skp family chaperone for outer membrane proteins
MKTFNLSILILILSYSVFAQSKVAIINSDAFEDEKTGIKEYARLINEIGYLDLAESFQASYLRSEIRKLEKESPEKIEELLTLRKELRSSELKIEELRKEYINKLIPRINKVIIRILKKIEEFAKQRGYLIIFEINDSNKKALAYIDKSIDITKEFIEFCNAEFEKEKAKKLK